LNAAIENGADAVYFGLNSGHNARARAANLELDELPEIMAELHRRGVRGYLTLNTLVFTDELADFEAIVRAAAACGVDAVLVQDLGAVRLIRATCPDLPIHASTQMTLTSAEGIELAAELGIERVVLARELALREIRRIRQRTQMPLEAFVHGALCVAYSGQCLTSEALGGRSANRGQCAQACRLPYELVCNGEDVDLGPQKYLLSPQDLAAYDLTPELIEAGVMSFKIEGRLKTPEYVANITRHYRRAIDAAVQGGRVQFSRDEIREMELSFSRGFSTGWLQGCDHKALVPALSSAKRGVYLGEVLRARPPWVTVRLASPVAAGDGVVFEGDRLAEAEQGGRIVAVRVVSGARGPSSFRTSEADDRETSEIVTSGVVELRFSSRSLDVDQLSPGQAVWKTDDPQLTAKLRATYQSADPVRRVPLSLSVQAHVGSPLVITARSSTASAPLVRVESPAPLAAARNRPADDAFFQQQLGRLGHTVYELTSLDIDLAGGPMVPLSVLSRLRQDLIAQLDTERGRPPERRIAAEPVLDRLRATLPRREGAQSGAKPTLRVLCRSLDQLQVLLDAGVQDLYADFQHIREYRTAIHQARSAGARLSVATPRIQKPQERGLFVVLARYQPDGILVRNLAGLRFFRRRGLPMVADFSLNVTNELTAQYLIGEGAEHVTTSYDLNREQLLELVRAVPGEWLEVVIHQHMPMFHMEHCVFCAMISPGTNKTNCGRPCDRQVVHLRDRVGSEHRLLADIGCRNTLFNAVPQSAAEIVPALVAAGVRQLRLELLDESPGEIRKAVELYSRLLAGEIGGEDVWRQLHAMNRVGVTRGTLEERRNPLAIL
jgi:U32 family peptidase